MAAYRLALYFAGRPVVNELGHTQGFCIQLRRHTLDHLAGRHFAVLLNEELDDHTALNAGAGSLLGIHHVVANEFHQRIITALVGRHLVHLVVDGVVGSRAAKRNHCCGKQTQGAAPEVIYRTSFHGCIF